jgi:hypothetical protein
MSGGMGKGRIPLTPTRPVVFPNIMSGLSSVREIKIKQYKQPEMLKSCKDLQGSDECCSHYVAITRTGTLGTSGTPRNKKSPAHIGFNLYLQGFFAIGGERGIRTPGTPFQAYNGLAIRRFQPLSHLSQGW